MQTSGMCAAHKLHHHTSWNITVFVDIHGTFLVSNEELAITKSEHAQWPKIFDAMGNAHKSVRSIRSLGSEVWHRPGLFLVQCENFNTTLGGDGEGGVEHVNPVTLGRDVKLVIFAEELGLRTARLEEAALAGGWLLYNGFKDLGVDSFSI